MKPPKNCDACRQPIGGRIYDAATKPYGQWAWLCARCFARLGYGLGTGIGQEFQETQPSVWQKTAG